MTTENKRNIWLFVGVIYFIIPALFIAVRGPEIAGYYQTKVVPPPSLTMWAIHSYSSSLLFILGVVPVLMAWFDSRRKLLCSSHWYPIAIFMGGAQLVWVYLIWLGLWLPIAKMEKVVG